MQPFFDFDDVVWHARRLQTASTDALACFLQARYVQRLLWLVVCLCMVLLALFIGQRFVSIAAHMPRFEKTVLDVQQPIAAQEKGRYRTGYALEESGWFGGGVGLIPVQENIKDESLYKQWRLSGTIAGALPSAVFVHEKTGQSKLVKEGAYLEPDVRLEEVIRRSVVLKEGHVFTRLFLAGTAFTNAALGRTSAEMVQEEGGQLRPEEKKGEAAYDWQKPLSERLVQQKDEVILSRHDVLEALRTQGTVYQNIRLVPRLREGLLEGFRITSLPDTPLIKKLGLQENDILVRVNGVSVAESGTAMQWFTALPTAREMEIVLNRKGRQLAVIIKVDG